VIFSDPAFLALLGACWICFAVVPRQHRTLTLAAFGAVFYAIYAGAFAVAAVLAAIAAATARHRWQYWVVGSAIVATLIYFKQPGIIVPIGLTNLPIEKQHVAIDLTRERIARVRIVDMLAYALFMPCRMAGPIRRYPQFMTAVGAARPSMDHLYAGTLRVLIGFAKKLIIADTLALTETELTYVATATHAWTITVVYAVRIYVDFSAYSDIAIGFAQMLGIVVPENFSYPYFATSIRDFWVRWHITLSEWVRDYSFVPLSRTLFGTALRPWPSVIAAISYLVTFVLVGAWHGLTAGFLVWGAYHGVLLGLHHVWRAKAPAALTRHPWYHSRAAAAVSIALTFVCVCVGWVPFMTDLPTARKLLALMLMGGSQ
jgi:alginate O-acetyltransferase complex protein AlgI